MRFGVELAVLVLIVLVTVVILVVRTVVSKKPLRRPLAVVLRSRPLFEQARWIAVALILLAFATMKVINNR